MELMLKPLKSKSKPYTGKDVREIRHLTFVKHFLLYKGSPQVYDPLQLTTTQ